MSDAHQRTAMAQTMVKRYSMIAGGLGVIPMPYVDIVAIIAVQVRMVAKLTSLYDDITFSSQSGKSIIASLIGSFLPAKLAYGAAGSLVKAIPLVGPVAGLLTMPAFSAASTYAVGKVFVQHFESGGTFLSFDPDRVRDHYQSILEAELDDAPAPTAASGKRGKAGAGDAAPA